MNIFIMVLCALMFLSFGFILGIVCSAWATATKAKKTQDVIFKGFGREEKAARLTSTHQVAVAFTARCWCDPRTYNTEMDTNLGMVFAETLSKYIDALQWCSGAADFQRGGDGVPEGIACEGFDRICRPLMSANDLIDVNRLSIISYKRLRKMAPELLGLGKRS